MIDHYVDQPDQQFIEAPLLIVREGVDMHF
jgi:hypothetical protein